MLYVSVPPVLPVIGLTIHPLILPPYSAVPLSGHRCRGRSPDEARLAIVCLYFETKVIRFPPRFEDGANLDFALVHQK